VSAVQTVLNYTRRQTIRREHVTVRILPGQDNKPPKLDVVVDFTPYAGMFKPNDRISVEAYLDVVSKSFAWGTVGSPNAPDDCALDHLESWELMYVTVRIVDADDRERPGRVAGICSRIQASSAGAVQSLLPIVGDTEMRGELWRFDITDDGPIVRVNAKLVGDRQGFARSPAFLSLVFPCMLRDIVDWILGDCAPSKDEMEKPRGLWLRWMLDLIGEADLPEGVYPREDAAELRRDFVNDVIAKFDADHKLLQKYLPSWYSGESEDRNSNGAPA
jgi:hypothetical protein